MTYDEYEAVKAAICPYCKAKISEKMYCDDRWWVHSIPGTSHSFACMANSFRKAGPWMPEKVYVDKVYADE